MRLANEAMTRIRYPIPTVDDISFKLNGATHFSRLDRSQAYHQLELDEASRYITTFSTHLGLFRYKRLNYGTHASAELFQYTLATQLQGLEGVQNIANDIIVYGTSLEEQDRNLENFLKRLEQRGLKLNPKIFDFLQNELHFFGQVFSREGIRPDPKRIADLQNALKQRNVQKSQKSAWNGQL